MALKLKIENCGGKTHEIVVTYTDHGFEVEILNHDVECDLLREELGEALPRCYHYATTIMHDFDTLWGEIFQDVEVRAAFINAISEQGISALEITEEAFADYIMVFLEDNLRWREDSDLVADLLDLIRYKLPWFVDTTTFKRNKLELAQLAHGWDAPGVFSQLHTMTLGSKSKIPLVSVVVQDKEFEDRWGYSDRTALFIFKIGNKEMDRWKAHYRGWYWDVSSMEWHEERADYDSQEPENATIDFLEIAGFDYKDIETEEIGPQEPTLPQQDESGNYAIFHNEYLWARYKDAEDASVVNTAMMEAYEYTNICPDFDIQLMKLRENLTEEQLEDLGDDDIDKWEQY